MGRAELSLAASLLALSLLPATAVAQGACNALAGCPESDQLPHLRCHSKGGRWDGHRCHMPSARPANEGAMGGRIRSSILPRSSPGASPAPSQSQPNLGAAARAVEELLRLRIEPPSPSPARRSEPTRDPEWERRQEAIEAELAKDRANAQEARNQFNRASEISISTANDISAMLRQAASDAAGAADQSPSTPYRDSHIAVDLTDYCPTRPQTREQIAICYTSISRKFRALGQQCEASRDRQASMSAAPGPGDAGSPGGQRGAFESCRQEYQRGSEYAGCVAANIMRPEWQYNPLVQACARRHHYVN